MRFRLTYGALLFAFVAAGCAGSDPPLQTESSTSAISTAEAVGAKDVPQAALHLQLAREELAQAKSLADKGDKDKADSMLLRAEADAELAALLSKEQTEQTAAAEAMARVRQLQNDNR